MGSYASNGSGDIFVAFSTGNPGAWRREGVASIEFAPNEAMGPLFRATVESVEEAIVNALVAAETMTGINDNTAYALPHDRLQDALRRYGRLNDAP